VVTGRKLIRLPALVSSILAPLLFVVGLAVVAVATPGYDPVRTTISELAAVGSPTRVAATILFIATALCHFVTITFARGIGIIGRIVFLCGALASLAIAALPLPAHNGSSSAHDTAAIVGFVLLAAWPLFGMRFRRDFPWIVRPVGSLLGTVVLTAICLWFLVIWTSTSLGYVGLVERIAADAESIWPAIVCVILFTAARKRYAGVTPAEDS
jgi:hypothetical protein